MSSNLYQRVREPRTSYNRWQPTTEEVVDYLINRRVRNNQNWVGAVCGETGSGKSYTALRIGEMVDPNFGSDNIVFSVREFLETFDSRSPGEMVVFDEGQEWSARRAMSKKNVELTDVMTMLRFSLVNVLFTVPDIHMVDISLRRLMHGYLVVEPINRATALPRLRDKSMARIYLLKHQRRPGSKTSEPRPLLPAIPIVRGKEKQSVPINSALFTAPRPALLAAYEARKREVFHERLARARATLGGPSTPPAPQPRTTETEDLAELM